MLFIVLKILCFDHNQFHLINSVYKSLNERKQTVQPLIANTTTQQQTKTRQEQQLS